MINKTLKEFRNLIEEIIVKKNENLIKFVPPFSDNCLQYYCQNDECFNKLNNKDMNNSMTFILNNVLGKEWKNNSTICIFCMVNISLDVNNPPRTPYIDINKFKKLFYICKTNLTNENIKAVLKEGREIIKLVSVYLLRLDPRNPIKIL